MTDWTRRIFMKTSRTRCTLRMMHVKMTASPIIPQVSHRSWFLELFDDNCDHFKATCLHFVNKNIHYIITFQPRLNHCEDMFGSRRVGKVFVSFLLILTFENFPQELMDVYWTIFFVHQQSNIIGTVEHTRRFNHRQPRKTCDTVENELMWMFKYFGCSHKW